MSFTKKTFESIFKAQSEIFDKTTVENDLTDILNYLNSAIYVKERVEEKDIDLSPILNEIVSDIISVISSSMLGHYRLAASGLRNILELSCAAFYYLDHKIEYKLYKDFDFKADKYVSTLINEYHFYKSNYVKTFNPRISEMEDGLDSCSLYLNKTYIKLCDVVHGRYLTLTRTQELKIEYNHSQFRKFKTMMEYTLGAFFLMYILRFDDFSNKDIIELVKITKVLKNECITG